MSCSIHAHSCLMSVPIFQHLTQEELNSISEITYEKEYKKGETIVEAGEYHPYLYVLFSGKIKMTRISINGKEQVIRIVEEGDFLGELTLLNNKPVDEYAFVVEDAMMCVVDGIRLKELMMKQPTIAFKLLEVLSQRLDEAQHLIKTTNLASVNHRIAQQLIKLAEKDKAITLQTSKGDFANMLGITQETLSRKLSLFEKNKWIRLEGQRTIVVLDEIALNLIN